MHRRGSRLGTIRLLLTCARTACARTACAITACAVTACGDAPPPQAPAQAGLIVEAARGALQAPDTVRAGWTRVALAPSDARHIVVVFRLPGPMRDDTLTAWLAALDTLPVTPAPAVAMGGPEMGARNAVHISLTPGHYLLACVTRGDDGHRHAHGGEHRRLTVVGNADDTNGDTAARADSLVATQTLRLVDFAYVGPEQWTAGAHLVRLENTGAQDHQLRLVRLREGATVQAWMAADDPDTLAAPVAGMARMGPGTVAYLPLTLEPGRYVAYCLVGDAASRRPHVELGMLRAIEVR